MGERDDRGWEPGGQDVPIRRLFVRMGLAWAVFTVVAAAAVYARTVSLVDSGALDTARSYVNLVVAARSWNASHGGVWVEKQPGVTTNPYLSELGIGADTTTTDGRVLTLRNPAPMTREISEVLAGQGGVTFRLTSLKPINPSSAPDMWERDALAAFDRGQTEAWRRDVAYGVPVLRYMRPLITDESCLKCHARQGYRVGDIRGAVSVSVPLSAEAGILALNATALGALGLVSAAVMLGLIRLFVRRMRGQLDEAEAALVEAATVDALTGVGTRRHTMERLRAEIERERRDGAGLALIMLDIDWFKSVNDRLGHAAGDRVLTEVARRAEEQLRPYDVLGRIGGEEFLIIAPGADGLAAETVAERVRGAVATHPVALGDERVDVTVSLGWTVVDPLEPDSLDRALARADRALYRSKAEGRNRVSGAP